MKPIYVDKNVRILSGDEAKKALREKNDLPFVNKSEGVITVPRERWEEAQYAERLHWMERGYKSIEDRNDYHESAFEDYGTLNGKTFGHAIELGCGPFTNLRIIGKYCSIEKCTLLDPLIGEYLSHPNCTYDDSSLCLAQRLSRKTLINMVMGRFFTPVYNALRKRLNPAIPVAKLLDCPVEQMPVDSRYDLACIINVIEHCYDINRVFANILEVMKPGGVIVFHDRYYDHDEVLDIVQNQYDAAHPLKVDRKRIDSFLADNFEPLFRKVTHNRSMADGIDDVIAYDELYFIGTRTC